MDARGKFLDTKAFDAQVIYPSMGALWHDVNDPASAAVALTLAPAGGRGWES